MPRPLRWGNYYVHGAQYHIFHGPSHVTDSQKFNEECQTALSLLQSQKVAEATLALEKLTTSWSTHADAWCYLGYAYLSQERDADAITALERALLCSPTHMNTRVYLAYAYSKTGKHKEASATCIGLLDSNSGDARKNILRILKVSLREIDDKVYVATRTLEILGSHPNDAEIISVCWDLLYSTLTEIDVITAVSVFLEHAPEHIFAREVFARALSKSGEVEQANQEFELIAQTLGANSSQDYQFHQTYNTGICVTNTAPSQKRRERFRNLVREFEKVSKLEGEIAECGMYKGLSAYIICSTIKRLIPIYDGASFYGFDSFEGLSQPQAEDLKVNDAASQFQKGNFSASLDLVSKNLAEFSDATLFKGWIPSRFSEVKSKNFKFIHIDVDLYQPTLDSLEFFYPRLVAGGTIVCDDYNWSGQEQAVKEYCSDQGIEFDISPYNQAVIRKT